MDFLKACTTNIHAVENLVQTAYCVYDWTAEEVSDKDKWEHAQNIVTALRRDNVLCTSIEYAVWIFGHFGDEQKSALDSSRPGFSTSHEGTLESPPTHAPDGRAVRDVLLEAIELALAFTLAKDPAIVHVGPWLWLYHSVDEDEDYQQTWETSIIHIYTKFTPSGGLYLIPNVSPSCCQPMPFTPRHEDEEVVLAPHGKVARLLPGCNDRSLLSEDAWKSNLVKGLEPHGIGLSVDAEWVNVELLGESAATACIWPAELCFARPRTDHHWSHTTQADRDWRRWFISTEEGTIFRNPLSVSEDWFKSSGERERAGHDTASAEVSKILDEQGPAESVLTNAPANDATPMTSPPFSQRAVDQQAVMAGIYPTPPDGYAPALNASQLNPTTPSVTQVEQSLSSGDLAPTSDDVQYKAVELLHSGQEAYQSEDQDMLFGDEGEMEFGEDDIGDADFSFFDDPDNETVAMPLRDGPLEDAMKQTNDADDTEMGTGEEDIPIGATEMPSGNDISEELHQSDLGSPTQAQALQDAQESPQPSLVTSRPQFGNATAEPEKPLSPFGIRERLFDPPVPASFTQNDIKQQPDIRRNSTFAPISFREGLDLSRKYSSVATLPERDLTRSSQLSKPDIGLPAARKKGRNGNNDNSDSETDSESEGYSYDPSSSEMDEEELPPRLPWESKKRKRHAGQDNLHPLAGSLEDMWSDDESANDARGVNAHRSVLSILSAYPTSNQAMDLITFLQASSQSEGDETLVVNISPTESVEALAGPLPKIETFYNLPKEDLICISQIINEQSVTALAFAESSAATIGDQTTEVPIGVANYLCTRIERGIETVFPDVDQCDLGKIALTREPLRTATNPGKAPQGPPRPPQRSDSMMLGPDYFHLPSPYVKVQRSLEAWEMLPTCLSFWETLGLGPTNGAKNVRAFCVFPENEDLQRLVDGFMSDIATAYENCKLGSHVHIRNVSETDEHDTFEDGMAPVELNEDASLEGAMKSYAASCADLGKALSSIAHQENDRAIVVYLVNPFFGQEAQQHLCACFWVLFKAYRDNLPKAQRNQAGSDIFLQMLPINMVASYDALVVPDAKQMAILAREVYDRCPPPGPSSDNASVLPILAAPAVELAGAAPKRIGFQLAAEPPTDLLHEGSILHVAYSVSKDRHWMSVSWIDNTGRHQSSTSFCLRGRSFAEVIEEVWDCTRDILAARQVLWRVFIATTDVIERPVLQCWRTVSAKARPQAICVTLLTIDCDPVLQLSPPLVNVDGQLELKSDGGFLTPASTPQAGNFTSSPDVSGQGGNAPPTPAPSETAASIAETDPEAHLTDLTDETWGVLLSPRLSNVGSNIGLANGALFKRGDIAVPEGEGTSADKLPSIGVSIHWTIQVKPAGGVDEGSVKQAELTLRDVLRMYRNLALLTRARGLSQDKMSFMPVHIAAAVRGAKGLDGMLSNDDM